MKIELLSRDGTSRTIGTASSIPICLDLDLGPGWVERDGLVWTADKAEAYPNDDGGHSTAVILCDGVRTSLESIPVNDIEAADAKLQARKLTAE